MGLMKGPKYSRIGCDAFLLAAYACKLLDVHYKNKSLPPAFVDLGSGDGSALLGVLSLWRGNALGIDINKELVDQAKINANRLCLKNAEFIKSDLKDVEEHFKGWKNKAFLVVANPPWRPPFEGRRCENQTRNIALWAKPDTLKIFCKAASYFLKNRGHFCCISSPATLPDLLMEMKNAGLGIREILPLFSKAAKPATRILLRAQKNAKSLPSLLPPLVLHEQSKWSAQALAFCPWLAPAEALNVAASLEDTQ